MLLVWCLLVLPLHIIATVLLLELYSHGTTCGISLLLLKLHHLQLLVLADRNRTVILGLELGSWGPCSLRRVDGVAKLRYNHRAFLTLSLGTIRLLLELGGASCVGELHLEDLVVNMLRLGVHDCRVCADDCYLSIMPARLGSSHLLLHVATVLLISCRTV